MLDTFKKLLANQYEAALCTLSRCVDKCPESAWDMRIGIYPFSQCAFHALFFTDYYLGPNEAAFREQPFHRECLHGRCRSWKMDPKLWRSNDECRSTAT